MADIVLAGAADWTTCNGGGEPAAGDTISLNGNALTLNGDDARTYTCVSIGARVSLGGAASGGTIVLNNATSTIAANLLAGTDDLITLAAGANRTLTVNGDGTGGTAATKHCIYVSGGTHTLTVSGTWTGGSAGDARAINLAGGTVTFTATTAAFVGGGAAAHGLRCAINSTFSAASATGSAASSGNGITASSGTITVTAATGGASVAGISISGATISVTTATGGSGAGAHGVQVNSGTCTITTAKGGSAAGALGVLADGGTTTVNGTDLTGTGYAVGVRHGALRLAAGVKLQYLDAAGNPKKFYGPDQMPAVGTVADGTSYGGTDFEGTRIDCPAVKAVVTGIPYYGDPDDLQDGLYVEANANDVRHAVMFGGNAAIEGNLFLPSTDGSGDTEDATMAALISDTAHFGTGNTQAGTLAAGGGAALSRVRLGM